MKFIYFLSLLMLVRIIHAFVDCAQVHNYPNNYAQECSLKKNDPFKGPLQWRYIHGLGYRKFTVFGALERDYINARKWERYAIRARRPFY